MGKRKGAFGAALEKIVALSKTLVANRSVGGTKGFIRKLASRKSDTVVLHVSSGGHLIKMGGKVAGYIGGEKRGHPRIEDDAAEDVCCLDGSNVLGAGPAKSLDLETSFPMCAVDDSALAPSSPIDSAMSWEKGFLEGQRAGKEVRRRYVETCALQAACLAKKDAAAADAQAGLIQATHPDGVGCLAMDQIPAATAAAFVAPPAEYVQAASAPVLVRHDPHRVLQSDLRFVQKLGQGGFGDVYKLFSKCFGDVAVKMLRPMHELDCGPAHHHIIVAMFQKEARIIASLTHPNIVRYLGMVTEVDDMGYSYETGLMMEYIQGGSLADFLSSRVVDGVFHYLSVSQMAYLAKQIVRALHYVHQMGIIQLDVKPDNILLQDSPDGGPIVKLADFGLSVYSSEQQFTRGCGTLAYMAPEVYIGTPAVSWAADVFSLGIMFFEMMTLENPYIAAMTDEIKAALVTSATPGLNLPSYCPIDTEWLSIVKMCINPDPAQRPSCDKLLMLLNALSM